MWRDNKFYTLLRDNARLICFGVLVAIVSAVLVDIDHAIYEVFGVGESTGVWSDYPRRWLHDDAFVVGCVFLIIGCGCVFAFIRRLNNKGVLK